MFWMFPPDSRNARGLGPHVEVLLSGRGRAQAAPPEPQPVLLLGLGEVDQHVQPAGERLVQVRAQVGGQDGDALDQIHPLEQVRHLDAGVAVVRGADVGALAEQRVHLVESCSRRWCTSTPSSSSVLDEPAWASRLTGEDCRGLSLLFWTHVNPYGKFSLDMDKHLDLGLSRVGGG
jgi:hypothetical protein